MTILHIFQKLYRPPQFPIPKPGKDNTDPSNYRPIALTSYLCKTLEHINTRLICFFWKVMVLLLTYSVASGANGVQLITWFAWKRLFVKPSSKRTRPVG